MFKLLDKETMQELKIGDIVTDFRGEEHTLTGLFPNDGKTGKVRFGDIYSPLYYPSVINCMFQEF